MYLSDGKLNKMTIRGQTRVLWSLRPLVQPGDPALYRYRLPDERGADLPFESVVRVTPLRNGLPFRTLLRVMPVTALVAVAVVRSVH